jgi:hypothetical protein
VPAFTSASASPHALPAADHCSGSSWQRGLLSDGFAQAGEGMLANPGRPMCANTMHEVGGMIGAAVAIPFLYIADVTAAAVKAAGLGRVGLLGTRYTMERDFYRGPPATTHGLTILVPDEPGRTLVHRSSTTSSSRPATSTCPVSRAIRLHALAALDMALAGSWPPAPGISALTDAQRLPHLAVAGRKAFRLWASGPVSRRGRAYSGHYEWSTRPHRMARMVVSVVARDVCGGRSVFFACPAITHSANSSRLDGRE